MQISYKPSFLKTFNKLPPALQDEVKQKVELFRDRRNHKQLKTHKLHGRLKGRYSFSVNYQYRIVFRKVSKDEVVFLRIGDHDIYE